MKGLGTRVISGAVLLAVVLLALWVKGPLLMAAVAVAAALAAHEFYTMARHTGYAPWYPAGVALAVVLSLRGYLGRDILTGTPSTTPSLAEVLAAGIVLLLLLVRQGSAWARTGGQPREGTTVRAIAGRGPYLAWADLGLTLAGALYTGGLLGYAPLLAAIPETPESAGGTLWLLMVLLGTAACDTGAYFVGSMLGRRKLIPHISPGKTWEGLGGGALGGVLAALVLSGLLKLPVVEALLLGLIVCAAAVAGDLSESLIKRAVGVKDSGNIIPGHGGLLDRVDSILFVLPAVYWFALVAAR